MTEKNMARADFFTALVLIIFGVTAAVLAFQMPHVTARGQSPYSAPGLVPFLLGATIALLGLVLLYRSIKRTHLHFGINRESAGRVFREEGTRRMGVTILVCLLYTLALGKLPFPIITFLFVCAFILAFEIDRKAPREKMVRTIVFAVILAVCTSAVITGVFQYVFLVNLP